MLPEPINIDKWVRDNEHLLQPPVNNFCLHRGGFTVMIVGGPNERTDYHVNQTPEWFYMYKGHMCLKIVDKDDDGKSLFRDVIINKGDSFLLPGNVPHNPVRFANTIGIVVEQDRPSNLNDQIRWYCSNCKEIVYNKEFYLTDLGTQIKEGILEFDRDLDKRTCKNCGTLNYSKPQI
ncbi:3-hydroxyanthranilate 3,4-dioxygenase [Ascoidea rubescens DSM 1968]|uniref:3-hydroxyanthranilate 3,4-dioxygenase n=1 Tax=Ascoidea rubescens DSM 1968 TaxID=1344418 RepID=A0A1D2VJZ1_9ASCO|nr:3-hydroxyanthranilic acid dioxygenase, required for the de novo biosynthesis of NAD from tryptophan [Ascoidea rubescens DSM 1968]ODV61925.1 3-hydroxyanthranilic acid dioxygenase, required for the de novo biosynthesis of NAD from tryptophan [Ascoidea rubescens DSM 1968]